VHSGKQLRAALACHLWAVLRSWALPQPAICGPCWEAQTNDSHMLIFPPSDVIQPSMHCRYCWLSAFISAIFFIFVLFFWDIFLMLLEYILQDWFENLSFFWLIFYWNTFPPIFFSWFVSSSKILISFLNLFVSLSFYWLQNNISYRASLDTFSYWQF